MPECQAMKDGYLCSRPAGHSAEWKHVALTSDGEVRKVWSDHDDDDDNGFWVKHTVPVWVHVQKGVVKQVVGDDEKLTAPIGYVRKEDYERGWMDEDERPWSTAPADYVSEYHRAQTEGWPAWEWGW